VNQFELGRKEDQPSSGKTLKKANMQLEKYSSSNLLEIQHVFLVYSFFKKIQVG